MTKKMKKRKEEKERTDSNIPTGLNSDYFLLRTRRLRRVGAVTFPEEGDLGQESEVVDPTTGLTLRHRTAIVRTWDLVRPDIKIHGANFFLAAEVDGHEHTDAHIQHSLRLVMMSISSMVDNLDDVSVLVEILKTTAVNHKQRGIPHNDFVSFFQLLLSPVLVKYLRDNLGAAWSPVAEEGWTQVLKVINSVIFSVYEA
ncbi:hypothetical protein GWK47_028182 [Chionoecetes opilio]|uniref:Globin domain-containing protein n=1 Tax=Chionoecetes opilio TaxID=41210 RepID=A0A8J4YNT6_CHIOP|nr:hypothetical protein GWK47_028182 [Chionoecetes opilio]